MSADEALREMAQHRGLKLVKSRRRKAGVGDYGKYGLTDAGGRALLGIGDEGLTATAQDIENYLRAGAAGTWRQSADAMPDRPKEPAAKKRTGPDQVGEPATRARTRDAAGTRAGKSAAKAVEAASLRRNPAPSKQRPEPMPDPVPAPEPELVLRSPRPRDAAALAQLLSQLGGVAIDAAGIAANLAIVRKAGGGVVLAEKGKVIGCCSWSVVSSLHRGPIGRISAMIVEEKHRRRGVGTRLLDTALAELTKVKCPVVEVMSDIDLKNSHNFFRQAGFDQTSYRFARKID